MKRIYCRSASLRSGPTAVWSWPDTPLTQGLLMPRLRRFTLTRDSALWLPVSFSRELRRDGENHPRKSVSSAFISGKICRFGNAEPCKTRLPFQKFLSNQNRHCYYVVP